MQLTLPLRFGRFIEAADASEALNHHLERRPSGLWRMRVCLTTSRKVCGRRHKISLKTYDVEVARERRDKLLASFQRQGWILGEVRVQRPTGSARRRNANGRRCAVA